MITALAVSPLSGPSVMVRPYLSSKWRHRNTEIGITFSIPSAAQNLDWAKGRSLDTQRTTVSDIDAAIWLNFLTEAAHTGVSRLGNMLSTTFFPRKSGRCTVVRSPLTPPNLGASSPTAGSSPQSCTGVPLNFTVAMIFKVFSFQTLNIRKYSLADTETVRHLTITIGKSVFSPFSFQMFLALTLMLFIRLVREMMSSVPSGHLIMNSSFL